MVGNAVFSTIFLLILIADVRTQFFDFFNIPQLPQYQSPKLIGVERTTRRTKIYTIKTIDNVDSEITWKNTTIKYVYEELDTDNDRETSKEKRRKQTVPASTIAPLFNLNFYTTTQKPRKVSKNNSSRRNINNNNSRKNYEQTRITDDNDSKIKLQYIDYNVDKNDNLNVWYEKPANNIEEYNRPYYETTTKSYNYNNNNNYYTTAKPNNNYYTTKNPFYNRPGVKPTVVDDRPPITNRPATKRPFGPQTNRPTSRPSTNKPTSRPYIVNPIPTDAGAVLFPPEDEQPMILRGPDEDYMSASEKRRHIEIAERMCDKYKQLNMKQVQAIPLLPSPDPVQVNVSQCTPTTIPLVVGGKVVSINEFPHMALLGWEKVNGGGYSWKCGGSLISDRYILTAAHCSYQERDNTVVTGPPRVVQLGSSYLDDPGALVMKVSAVVRHPKYKFPKSYYDVALLKLVQPVTFSEVIKPACLGVPPEVNEPIIATGWGKTELGGDQSLELRSVSLPVWDMRRCKELLGTSRKMPDGPSTDSQLCAGEMRGGKDTCQGDSGGPAQIQDGCAWRIVAVTSLGRSCGAPNTPGLYALVHRAFIAAQVFGEDNYRNNQNRRSDNSQSQNTRDKDQNDYRRTTTTTTTKEYYSYNNQRNDHNSDYNNHRTNYNDHVYNYDNAQSNRNDHNVNYNNQNERSNNRQHNTRNQDQDGYSNYGQQNDRRHNSEQPFYNNQGRTERTTTTTTESYSYNNQRDHYGNNRQRNVNSRYDSNFEGRVWFTK